MDNNKAKHRLAVYRRTGEDAQDPFFAVALRQAEKDPALREWLADQQKFDSQFAAALGEVRGPREGRALIEATMIRRPARHPRWWPIALAASILVLFAVYISLGRGGAVSLPQRASAAELAQHISDHHMSVGLKSSSLDELRAWIAERGGPMPDALPAQLAHLGVIGCQVWETNRGKVSLVCFRRGEKDVLHLYVFEHLPDGSALPGASAPRYERAGEWSFALWQHKDCTYALGAKGAVHAEESLRRLLRA